MKLLFLTMNIPAEYYEDLAVVISSGLKHANIKPNVRKELRDWWTAEKEYMLNEFEPEKK